MASKDAYDQRLEAQMAEWQAKIDLLKARAERSEAENRIAYHEQVEALQQRREEIKAKLEELRDSGEDAWADIRSGTESAWKALDAAISRALQRFR